MQSSKIPKTGRIGRFARIIEKELGEKALLKIMQDSEKYTSFKSPEQAAWWKAAIERLEKETGRENAVRIMEYCGRKCCGQVKQAGQPFPTTMYCQCGVAWEKQFFESALEKPVEVELVQTVITGAESCKFIIHI